MWILVGAVVAVLATALWAVVWSPLLAVRQILRLVASRIYKGW